MRFLGISVLLVLVCVSAVHGFKDFWDKKHLSEKKPNVHVITVQDDSDEPENIRKHKRPITKPIVIVDRGCPGPNEVFYDKLPPCSITCSNLFRDCHRRSKTTISGCECKYNYARRHSLAPCEHIKKCLSFPRDCGENESWKACGHKCEESSSIAAWNSRSCQFEKCRPGCFCNRGYIRDGSRCVPGCKENEEYHSAKRRSDEDCPSESTSLSSTATTSGCFCKPGYYRISGTCQLSSQCPSACPLYETYGCPKRCNDELCGSNCPSKSTGTGLTCDRSEARCMCIPGFKRIGGVCQPQAKCPTHMVCTRANEVFKSCGKTADENCPSNTPHGDRSACSSGCFCITGYRRVEGICVPEANCQCKANEEYRDCGSRCEELCGTTTTTICSKNTDSSSCVRGCFCKNTYKRLTTQQDCIRQDFCPREPLPEFVL